MFKQLRKEQQDLILEWEALQQFYVQVQSFNDESLKAMGHRTYENAKKNLLERQEQFLIKVCWIPLWMRSLVFKKEADQK